MFQVIVSTFDVILLLLGSIFKLVYILGYLLTFISGNVMTMLHGLLLMLSEVGSIFHNDFCIFYEDLARICALVLTTGFDTIVKSAYLLFRCLNFTLTVFVSNSASNMYLAYLELVGAFGMMAETLKQLVILVGDSCWMLVTLLPNVMVFLVKFVVLLIVKCGENVFYMAKIMIEGVGEFFCDCADFWLDVPLQSLLGCLMFALLLRNWRRSLKVGYRMACALLRLIRRFVFDRVVLRWLRFTNDCKQYAEERRRRAMVRMREQAAKGLPSKNAALMPNDANLCVICQDRDKCVVLLPCRHLCICEMCANEMMRNRHYECPLCRVPLRSYISVFT